MYRLVANDVTQKWQFLPTLVTQKTTDLQCNRYEKSDISLESQTFPPPKSVTSSMNGSYLENCKFVPTTSYNANGNVVVWELRHNVVHL